MFVYPKQYDVIVIGAGHAGVEAALAAAKMGCQTLLLTINIDTTGLQFRMLNTKKGPSVWAPRAQCDKKAYQFRLKWVCERQPNLDVKQGQTSRLLHKDHQVVGVETTH